MPIYIPIRELHCLSQDRFWQVGLEKLFIYNRQDAGRLKLYIVETTGYGLRQCPLQEWKLSISYSIALFMRINVSYYRLLKMCSGQVSIFCMSEQNVSKLEMCSCFHPWRWFEIEYGLQALYTVLDIWWVRRAEIFSQPQKGDVPVILTRGHLL